MFLLGCNNFKESNTDNKHNSTDSSLSISKIDYKQNIYNLFLGQTKDSLKKVIEIQRNFEEDRNIAVDSIEHYMNIGENLIKVINIDTTDVLPATYFTFSKGVLIDFECSIIYESQEKNDTYIFNFLSFLKPFFGKLFNETNRRELSQKLSLQFDNSKREEKFYIDTSGQYDILFVYKISAK